MSYFGMYTESKKNNMKMKPVIDANTLRKMDFMIFLFFLRYYFEIETFYTCTMATLNFGLNPAISLLKWKMRAGKAQISMRRNQV